MNNFSSSSLILPLLFLLLSLSRIETGVSVIVAEVSFLRNERKTGIPRRHTHSTFLTLPSSSAQVYRWSLLEGYIHSSRLPSAANTCFRTVGGWGTLGVPFGVESISHEVGSAVDDHNIYYFVAEGW